MTISEDLGFGNAFRTAEVDKVRGLNILADSPFDFDFETRNNTFRVKQQHINRPDLIAYEAIGEPNFYPIIMFANEIHHPRELEVGMELEIPKPSEISEFRDQFYNNG